jgi:hypothetical protein
MVIALTAIVRWLATRGLDVVAVGPSIVMLGENFGGRRGERRRRPRRDRRDVDPRRAALADRRIRRGLPAPPSRKRLRSGADGARDPRGRRRRRVDANGLPPRRSRSRGTGQSITSPDQPSSRGRARRARWARTSRNELGGVAEDAVRHANRRPGGEQEVYKA